MTGGGLVWLGAGWWAASSTLHWATAALARKPRHPVRPAAMRPVADFSVVAPLNGADDASIAYIAHLRELSQAGAEILICVASDDDGAVAPLHAQWPEAPLLSGSDKTFNPKMNNVRKGLEAASRDIVVLCDAGIELTADVLVRTAASLSGGIGLVLALKAAEEPLNFAAELERSYINGHQARFLFAADRLGITVASGGITMLSRETLQRVGNWQGFNRWIADDYSVTRSVRESGLQTRLGQIMPRLPLGHRRWSDVWLRQLRWTRTRLRLPVWPLVLWEPAVGWAASGAAGGLALAGCDAPWGFLAAAALVHTLAWLAGEKWFMSGRHLAFGPHAALAALVRECLAPLLMLGAFSGRTILWRGTDLGGQWRRESARRNGAAAGGDGASGSAV